jgi:DNA-binding PadR family transcriptional regulator
VTHRPPRTPRALLSPTNLHILLSLAERDRHGYGIKLDIEERTRGELTIGPATLYEAIYRMAREGLVEAAEPRTRGRSEDHRRLYRITAEGRRRMQAELDRLREILQFARSRSLLAGAKGAK